MTAASTRVWLLLGIVSFGDFVWCASLGMGLSHWWPLALVAVALMTLTLACRLTRIGPRLGATAEWILLWLIFSVAGAVMTYLAAAQDGAVYDARLTLLDAELGFRWSGWLTYVENHPLLKFAFAVAYGSLLPQVLFSVWWFSFLRWDQRNAELLTNAMLALLLTAAVFFLFPALGPCVGAPACHDAYVEDLVGLRHGNLPSLDMMLLKGVIAFPSFHAVLAMLFTYAHRRAPTFLPMAGFNGLMLLSIPSEGGHYLVDIIGGVVVGGVAILATSVLPPRVPVLAPATTA
jgi:hypothetical protein